MFVRAYTSSKDDLQADPFGTPIYFNASTSMLARDGMSLNPDRWKLENYHRAGGPVLWAHKHELPAIGSGTGKTDLKRLRVGVVFDQEDPFARSVESKVRRKFIRGSSVGWDFINESGEIIKHNRAFASTLARDAWYDLSELSIVNVPSDPHAVSERQWHTLRSIHPGLAGLYEDQERWDSDVTAPELRRALIDYCDQLGLDLRHIRAAANGSEYDDDEPAVKQRNLFDDDEPDLSKKGADDEDEDGEDEDDGEEPDPALVRRSQLAELLRAHGVDPNPSVALPSARSGGALDEHAAKAVLSAFAFQR